MNGEVLAVRPDQPASDARALLRSFAVGGAPVVDEEQRPLGFISLRDVIDGAGQVEDWMQRPAVCVDASTDVRDAAKLAARSDVHHLVVVDGGGVVIGLVSPLDLVRALSGLPPQHPPTFPHWDPATHASWTDLWPLDDQAASHAPDAPGVLVLVPGTVALEEGILWLEACNNVRRRVQVLAERREPEQSALSDALASRCVHFRAAVAPEEDERKRVLAILQDRLTHKPPPGAT